MIEKPNRTIWARIGITLDVTEEEYEKIKAEVEGSDGTISEELAEAFFMNGRLDGESYIPAGVFELDALPLWTISYNGKKYLARDVYFNGDNEVYTIAEESLSPELDDSTLEGVGLDNTIKAYVPKHMLYWDDEEIEEFVLKMEGVK